MIGYLQGEVLFSDGQETIINCPSGIGYQIYYNKVLAEDSQISLYISHIVRETSEDLYGFNSLREKKIFEMLILVKGVGPKSAFSLLSALTIENIIEAILFENKKMLTAAPGVGPKAAAQMILDLKTKVGKIKMFSSLNSSKTIDGSNDVISNEQVSANSSILIDDVLMACKELGFSEKKILPLAQKILNENEISKAEQLVHLVLKGI